MQWRRRAGKRAVTGGKWADRGGAQAGEVGGYGREGIGTGERAGEQARRWRQMEEDGGGRPEEAAMEEVAAGSRWWQRPAAEEVLGLSTCLGGGGGSVGRQAVKERARQDDERGGVRGCGGGWVAEACLRGDKGHKDLTFRAFCGIAIKFCVRNTPLALVVGV